ncbi:MAG TPA: c-type cytochrome [Candidatus Acidoferrum sp.]|nr:c-type cytochrome [Candidatus Acidoferrum sp.]
MERVSMMKKSCKVGGVLLIAFAFAMPSPVKAQPGNAANGQKIFLEKCKKCHGEDGSGNTNFGKSLRAADLRSADVQKKTDADFYLQIDKGKKNMPPFGASLDKTQINDVIAYVRQLGKK